MVLAVWDMCSSFYIARAMIGRKKKTMTAWKRKIEPAWIWRQKNFLFRVFALKMDKFPVTEQGMLTFVCKFNFYLCYRTESTHN